MVLPFTRWQSLDPTGLVCRSWDQEDEHVVFNQASGDLHLLNASAFAVLTALQPKSLSLEELAEQFPEIAASDLQALIESLDQLGIVRPVAP